MEAVVRTARTVEEAEELALKELGVDRSAAEVEVLSRGKAGFLGIGGEAARVRVTLRSAAGAAPPAAAVADTGSDTDGDTVADNIAAAVAAAPAPVAAAEAGSAADLALVALNNILSTAGVNVTGVIRAANDAEAGGPILDITGPDSGLLIGRRGQTLHSLQFIVSMIVRREFGEGVRITLDVEQYRRRRETSLRDMASKVAERVAQTGRTITLEPMSAADRRIIHISLADSPSVSTESIGFGDDRKVSVIPKR